MLVEKFRETNQFTPWLCSSQPCEKIFRQIRSMTSTFSTVVNFNLLSILRRLNRLQILNEISTDLSKFNLYYQFQLNRINVYQSLIYFSNAYSYFKEVHFNFHEKKIID